MQISYLNEVVDFTLQRVDSQWVLNPEQEMPFSVQLQALEPGHYLLTSQGQVHDLWVSQIKDQVQVFYRGEYYFLKKQAKSAAAGATGSASNQIVAPLTGKVFKVPVEEGQSIEAGMPVVILESMKMETSLNAPFDALVETVHCQEGDQVTTDQILVTLTPSDE